VLEALHHQDTSRAQIGLRTGRHSAVEDHAPLLEAVRDEAAVRNLLSQRPLDDDAHRSTEDGASARVREVSSRDDRGAVPDSAKHGGCLRCRHVDVHDAYSAGCGKCEPRLPHRSSGRVPNAFVELGDHPGRIATDHSDSVSAAGQLVCDGGYVALDSREGVASHDVDDVA
jgi:hypothetical protein